MIYAVQVRNMHSAIHHLVMFKTRKLARDALLIAHETELFPYAGAVSDIEINFRNPPAQFKGENLTIVNNDAGLPTGIPDVY